MIEHTKEQVELSRLTLTPLKLVPPGTHFFLDHSEKFVPTIGQAHETKPVTTKDISGVHSCICRKMNDAFHEYASTAPHSVRNVRSLQT